MKIILICLFVLFIIITITIIIIVRCNRDRYISRMKNFKQLSYSQSEDKPNTSIPILSCLGKKRKAPIDLTGTSSQTFTTITGVGTTFTTSMVGNEFVFANGISAGTITAVGSATNLTVSTSQTVIAQGFSLLYIPNLQSSIAWCLLDFLIGTGTDWNKSPLGKIILEKVPNTFSLTNILNITLATCPDPTTGEARETCAFTGNQCACGWLGFPACQNPAQNACPRNPDQECSCGGKAVIQALLNDISNVSNLKVDSIDNVSIPNLLDNHGFLELVVTVSIPDLFIEGGAASASAWGYLCPSPWLGVGAHVTGLGCTVGATVQLSIKAKLNQDGSNITLENSSVDFTIKSYKVYNGVGWLWIDIAGISVPFGIEMIGIIVNILSASNVFYPWFGSIINSLKDQILGPINTALGNIKIPIGNNSEMNQRTYSGTYKTNILDFSKNNEKYYKYFHNDMYNTNFNNTLGTHYDTLKMYSTGTKCKIVEDFLYKNLINTFGGKTGIFSKLQSSYDLSNVKTTLITPSSETDKLGTVVAIKRSDSSYAYSIALGLINFNFNFSANLTKLTGINLTTITIPTNGICIRDDKTISLTLDNEINNLAIGCDIESTGNLYIPYTTETITIDANPLVNSTFKLEMILVGKLDDKNILILDQTQCSMTFSNVYISLKTNLTMTSSEKFFQPIFDDISLDINTLVSDKLSDIVRKLVQDNFGKILTPIIVNLINEAKIPFPP